MSQQFPPQQPPPGRGAPPQQQGRSRGNSYYNAAGRGAAGRGGTGAWQPTPPPQSSLQQAAAGPYPAQQQRPPYGAVPYYATPYGAPPFPRPWQPNYAGPPPNARGGVFYPPGTPAVPGQPVPMTPAVPPAAAATTPPVVVPPRARKPLVITDKDGNVIDFSKTATKPSSSLQTAAAAVTPDSSSTDAGNKLKQAVMDRMNKDEEEKKKKEAEEKQIAEENAKKEAEEKAKKEAEEKAKLEAEEKAKQEAEETAKKEAEEKAKKASAPKSSLAKILSQSPAPAPAVAARGTSNRIVFTKTALFDFKNLPQCTERPSTLPDFTITRGPSKRRDSQKGGRGNQDANNGGDWSRQSGRRQSTGEGSQWSRGQAPPKGQSQQRGRGGRGGKELPAYDGPPLVKSENHWKPRKNTSALIIAEKQVKSILNKMTKEKFGRLSAQMLEIPISTYETLNMMIDNVYDKAIDEPAFGDMYADLCVKLSQSVHVAKLVHYIESDEEPPTEDGVEGSADNADVSHHTVYRWSNDVSTNDEQVVGPLASEEECLDAALDEEERTPVERGEMQLELVKVLIKRGIFIKIMKQKDAGDTDIFYTVYFPVGEAKDLGQQLSDIFLSQMECESDANKKNSFKRSLLNKCEEEFNKQDIYVEWKEEKKAYEETKSSLSAAEIAEKEEELDFRRIRIKKQMLGNVKFIGQLYKKRLLKEKIMRFCIGSLLKLEQIPADQVASKNPEYLDKGNYEMDEEDHEAICNMFTTIGQTIDTSAAKNFMDVCFEKIKLLSTMKTLPSRSRFMYKDLLDLRENKWVPRRKEEKAKTLEEIRKDVEREERKQAQESQQNQRGAGNFNPKGSGRGSSNDLRSSGRQPQRTSVRQPKPATETDEDGFTVVSQGAKAAPVISKSSLSQKLQQSQQSSSTSSKQAFSALAKPEPLSEDELMRKIKSMRADFLTDGGNVDELIMSMDEISGTPDAGIVLVSKNADHMMECKDDERKAIYQMISILFEKDKITKGDIMEGTKDVIELIDDLVVDSPRAYEYLGDFLGLLLRLKAVDLNWICEECEKTKEFNPHTQAPEKLIQFALLNLKKTSGKQAVADVVANDNGVTSLLGDKWTALRAEVIS
ncbi:translation initiation factor 4G [Fistulifera solaris]|uniref:Translation initiation factor 4G n=1 Tax=Fistulifera solaris TaxID=1519565 RepID=A0A1Z5JFV2_FISSO|nr:translation initiation factor 4G [Fistulifera solaris]|eukprot:GAX12806.1 translation initiation factor 4G [Fistulifera solaris]